MWKHGLTLMLLEQSLITNYCMGSRGKLLQETVSKVIWVILEISQASGPRQSLQIRADKGHLPRQGRERGD